MAADDVAAVAYLWDGSQPGWRLRVSHRHERRIVLHFGPSGPSVQELAAMREVFAELRGRTAAKVWAAVRGKEWLALDTVYGPIDAPRLVDAARGRGLRVEVRPTDTISYLPHNTTTGVALLIEDDEEAAVIANRMLAEGVPVDREEID